MTKLDAVNRILRAVNEFKVAALDTDGDSAQAIAEQVLDEQDRAIQARGWHENKEVDIELEPADVTSMALVIAGDGAWTVATRTLTKTAAFASYTWVSGDQISVTGGTGVTAAYYEIASRTSDNAIVLKEDIASANNADTTTDLIGWEDAISLGSDILAVDSYGSSVNTDITKRGDKLFDRDDNTFSFADNVFISVTRKLAFTDLSDALAVYITAAAAHIHQQRTTEGRVQNAFLEQQVMAARAEAIIADQGQADTNILNTPDAHRISGRAGVTQYGR